ncbi:MAG: hypothetical protein EOP06_11700 [Proteobacteria bacterium]|nr:MAG: hypothetical protein EOP06_11700 [Pseudomonadota bacterium]
MKMLKNSRGMTVAEMTVAMAIGAVLVLAVVNVMRYLRIFNQRAMFMSESRIASSLGERFLWLHFKNADPSFNNLRGGQYLDDNGRNFYDLMTDGESQGLAPAVRTRTITLSLAPGARTSFPVLIVNMIDRDIANSKSPTFFADPAKFYSGITAGSGAPGVTGGPSVNFALLRSFINSQNPKILSTGNKIIEIFSPLTIRAVGAPLTDFPNTVSYFLRSPDGADFTTETFANTITYRHAAQPGTAINNFDHFLKTLPSSGGGIPPLQIRSVRMLLYEIVKDDPNRVNPVVQLRYRTWNGSDFVNPVVVSTDVESVVITRRDITDTMITATLNMIRKVPK